jgi:hypothetical protein
MSAAADLDYGDTIDDAWVDAIRAGTASDPSGTNYDVRVAVLTTGATDGSGIKVISASSLGLTTLVGLIVTGNYAATAQSPTVQGVRIVSNAAQVRYINVDTATAVASSTGLLPMFVVAWGTA